MLLSEFLLPTISEIPIVSASVLSSPPMCCYSEIFCIPRLILRHNVTYCMFPGCGMCWSLQEFAFESSYCSGNTSTSLVYLLLSTEQSTEFLSFVSFHWFVGKYCESIDYLWTAVFGDVLKLVALLFERDAGNVVYDS